MDLLIYAIPFIIAIILLVFFKKYIVWWEYIVLIGVSICFTMIIREIFVTSRETATEYWGGYMVKITHYDRWNEYIHKTCTETVHDGYDEDGNEITHEETYDCSYVEDHPERWKYTDNYGNEEWFYGKGEFDKAMEELGYPKMVFRDMHRDYYTVDGDAQDYFWDNTVEHIRPLVWEHSYTNKVQCSNSVFNFEDISDSEADSLGLFKYPKVIKEDQDVILGLKFDKYTHKKFKYINSIYGPTRQFRMYVLIFKNKPVDIALKQKAYWKRGNKNEFVICLGYDTKTNLINWCYPFSWCDKPDLEVATKQYFITHNDINDLGEYPSWLRSKIHLWKRKEFKDFDYIRNNPTINQYIWLLIIILIIDLFVSAFIIGNEIDNNLDSDRIYKSQLLNDISETTYEMCKSLYENVCTGIRNIISFFIDLL